MASLFSPYILCDCQVFIKGGEAGQVIGVFVNINHSSILFTNLTMKSKL